MNHFGLVQTVDRLGQGVVVGIATATDDLYDSDFFLAKYDSDGMLLWAKQAGSQGVSDSGRGVAVDAAGNAMVVGAFGGMSIFGLGDPNETVLTAAGLADIFVAMYEPEGALRWVKQAGSDWDDGYEREMAYSVATDTVGNGIVTGTFRDTAIFGAGEPNETELTSAGLDEMFLAKFAGYEQATDQPDLVLAMNADPSPARVGRPWAYQMVVANMGSGAATRVVLADALPERVKLVSLPETCELAEEQVVSCLLGSLSAGAEQALQIVVWPQGPGVRLNAACVEAAEPDLNELDNCVELETSVLIPIALEE